MSAKARVRGTIIGAFLGEPARRLRRALHHARGARDLWFFHQADDAYSFLLAQLVGELARRHELEPRFVPIGAPARDVDPEPELRRAHGVRDARALADFYELEFPHGAAVPARIAVERAQRVLARHRPWSAQVEAALAVGRALWSGSDAALTSAERAFGALSPSSAGALLSEGDRLLRDKGHYLGGMLWHRGEWFWGVDRLALLEDRLGGTGEPLLRRRATDDAAPPLLGDSPRLEFFYSFRSPYSYLATERTLALAERHGVELVIRPVLPMVMRGLPVPRAKRLYIVLDAKREADRLGIPFGRVCDPVGVGVERCLAVFGAARESGRAGAFLASAGRGIWSEALDVSTDEDLREIVERAGLGWSRARAELGSDAWRGEATRNRDDLAALGLWGVPCFRLGDEVFWGQDRLVLIEDRLRRWAAARRRAAATTAPVTDR